MITNPDWLKSKEKPYLHKISLNCIEKLVECIESFDIEEMDRGTCFKMHEILRDEIDDPEFLKYAIENLDELFSYLINGNLNISIHRDITGEIWCGAGEVPNGEAERRHIDTF